MSLDIYLVTNEEVYVFDYNITHNLGKMASAAGLYEVMWDAVEQGYIYADQVVSILEKGIVELVCNKEYYESMNPENGWGSYDGLLKFAGKYLNACKENPTARIEVSR